MRRKGHEHRSLITEQMVRNLLGIMKLQAKRQKEGEEKQKNPKTNKQQKKNSSCI